MTPSASFSPSPLGMISSFQILSLRNLWERFAQTVVSVQVAPILVAGNLVYAPLVASLIADLTEAITAKPSLAEGLSSSVTDFQSDSVLANTAWHSPLEH